MGSQSFIEVLLRTVENRAPSSAVLLLGIAGMYRRRPAPDLWPGTWLGVAAQVLWQLHGP